MVHCQDGSQHSCSRKGGKLCARLWKALQDKAGDKRVQAVYGKGLGLCKMREIQSGLPKKIRKIGGSLPPNPRKGSRYQLTVYFPSLGSSGILTMFLWALRSPPTKFFFKMLGFKLT